MYCMNNLTSYIACNRLHLDQGILKRCMGVSCHFIGPESTSSTLCVCVCVCVCVYVSVCVGVGGCARHTMLLYNVYFMLVLFYMVSVNHG